MKGHGLTSSGGSSWEEEARAEGLRPEELQETFTRSPGPGGQNVNKVSTCVVLEHKPTGTVVRVATERYREQNRRLALARLAEKLRQARLARQAQARAERELQRRRNRPRPARLKAALRIMKQHRARRISSRRISRQDTE